MKDKKQKRTVIFGIICAVIIGVCLVIQFVIKKEDKKLQKEWQSVGDFIIDSLFFKKVTTTYNLLNSTVSLVYFNNLCTIMYLRKEKNYESRKNRKIYIKTA